MKNAKSIKNEIKIYSCIPNGDYNNEDESLKDTFGRAEFELNNGCQDWILLSKKKLTDEQYSDLLDALKEKSINSAPKGCGKKKYDNILKKNFICGKTILYWLSEKEPIVYYCEDCQSEDTQNGGITK